MFRRWPTRRVSRMWGTLIRTHRVVSGTVDADDFERLLEEAGGGSSELSEGARDTGRKVAHLPD